MKESSFGKEQGDLHESNEENEHQADPTLQRYCLKTYCADGDRTTEQRQEAYNSSEDNESKPLFDMLFQE